MLLLLLPLLLLVSMPQRPLPVYVVMGSFWFCEPLSSNWNVRRRTTVGKVGLGISTTPCPLPETSTLWSGCGGGPMILKRRNAPTAGSQDVPFVACDTVSTGPGIFPSTICCRFTRSTVWLAV